MKQFVLSWISILFFSCFLTHAQEITLDFPHFAGHQYDWKIFQGEKEITVRSDKIPQNGQVTLVMPTQYQDYIGMTRWMLQKGGGLDMIYVGKNFSVECLSEQPGPDNIIYKDNPENDYLSAQYQRQQAILNKLGAVNHLLTVYPSDDDLHKIALGEQDSLCIQFEQLQKERSQSKLYAARFGEIVDFTRGVADKVYIKKSDHILYFNDFVTHTLNFSDLYTSGHWDQVLHHWVMMNINSQDTDKELKTRLNTVFKRMNQNNILTSFAQKTVPLLVQKGKDDILPVVVAHLNKHPSAWEKLSKNVKSMILSVKIMTGKKAPDLVWKAPVLTQTKQSLQDITLNIDELNADYTTLLFYQGECQLCEDALIGLANKYKWLNEHNIKVIAISGDTSKQGFEKKLAYHQWPDNYCDLSGIDGVNFKKYGVLGVPTLFLINREGIILEKTATVNDVLKSLATRK